MTWIIAIPIVIFILFILSSILVVFWLRPKYRSQIKVEEKVNKKKEKFWTGKIKPPESHILGILMFIMMAGLAIPVIFPNSIIALMINEYGYLALLVWCNIVVFDIYLIVFILVAIMKRKNVA